MADFGDEIGQDLQQKAVDLLGFSESNTTNAAVASGSKADHTFDIFDDSFINSDSNLGHIPSSEICKKILFISICEGSSVRAWDVLLLLPNLTFIIFLAMRWATTKRKLRATNSPIFRAFHFLVAVNAIISVVRGVVSMAVAGSAVRGDHSAEVTDKMLWVLLQFFMLATEMSVLVFGVAGAQLDSRRSIKRVVAISALTSLIFSTSQCLLEFQSPDQSFTVHEKLGAVFNLFGHGGSAFWMVSSACVALVYATVLILPLLPCTKRNLALPNKASFYQYCGFLLLLYTIQTIGSGLIYFHANPSGLCLVNLTTFLYLTFYTPIVYFAFLSPFFRAAQPTLLFSYKAQVDDMEDDEIRNNRGSMQFSLTQGSSTLIQEEDQEALPIVLNGARPSLSVNSSMPEALASPDSVAEDEQFRNFRY